MSIDNFNVDGEILPGEEEENLGSNPELVPTDPVALEDGTYTPPSDQQSEEDRDSTPTSAESQDEDQRNFGNNEIEAEFVDPLQGDM